MRIVKYPHPTLRHKSKPLRRVDAELRKIVGRMLDMLDFSRSVCGENEEVTCIHFISCGIVIHDVLSVWGKAHVLWELIIKFF